MDKQISTLISECRKIIEVKLNWGPAEQWKQRDFEQLSDLIFEKTGTRLSLSTLKRMFAGQFTNSPQPATLNALAQFAGFSSWTGFRSSALSSSGINIVSPAKMINEGSGNRNRKFVWTVFGVMLFAGIAIVIFSKNKNISKPLHENVVELKPEVNFRYKILADGLPNTVVFSFDLDKVRADTFFFQQTWNDRTRVMIPGGSKNYTTIYYYPGYHTAKLFAGKKKIAEQRVHVKTNGWLGLADMGMNPAMPVYLENPVTDGMLYVSPSNPGLQKLLSGRNEFFIRYYNVTDFEGMTGDGFQLSAKIRNDIAHGGLLCQDVKFYITCESGMIIIPFCMPGCVGNLNLSAGDNFMAGKNNDLSALGIDLSQMQQIEISSDGKTIGIKTSASKLVVPYTKTLGTIKALMIEFRGSGAADDIKLSDASGKVKYDWNF